MIYCKRDWKRDSNGEENRLTTESMISPFETEWKLRHQGAESRIWAGQVMDRRVIKKERFEKTYRNRLLDERLTKERMRAEIRSILRLKESNCRFSELLPTIYFSNSREIVMSEIENAKTINEFTKENRFEDSGWFYVELGRTIADIHKANIVHGDITTSNFLVCSDRRIVPIDFGLAQFNGTVEDIAVDLYVLERSLLTNDYEHFKGFEIILGAYQKEMGKRSTEIMRKLEEVRLRGRKRSMVG